MSAFPLPRRSRAGWLPVVVLSAAVCLATARGAPLAFPSPAVPLPAHVNYKSLPAAFSKPVPSSMADLRDIQERVAALVTQVSPAVVAVAIGEFNGSGVVISADGLVLTAGHVGERAGRTVTFTFPTGKTAHGKTLGVDEDADTGLMRITDPGPWPHVSVGELSRARLGDWALALGHPGGFDRKRSLVARLGRIIRLSDGKLQTDCTIFPGDSGGPLFDMFGRVIGIHSSIASSAVENFHVPITDFFGTWDELIGPPDRPPAYSGLSLVDGPAGCRVGEIEEHSPASKVDLKVDDYLLKVDGRDILVSAMFERWLADSRPGEILQLAIKRGDKELSQSIELQSQPKRAK